MSYILEALKKADRERNLGDVPDLEAVHWGVRKTSRSSHWPWVAAALLLVNAVLLVYLFGRHAADEPGRAETVKNSPLTTPVPVPDTASSADGEQVLQRLPRPEREVPREPRPRVKYSPPAVAKPLSAQTVATSPALPVGRPQSGESASAVPAGNADAQLPEWNELPLDFRAGFALPHIDVHVFAEEPARRFVLIDLKKYREGETLANGALLEKINPGSIQLFYQGTRFRVDR